MTPAGARLGDSHNFGRTVVRRGRRIWKPRTLLWEWLLLSGESPLCLLLREAAAECGLRRDAFDFLPTVRFFGPLTRAGGEVERLTLEPLRVRSDATRRELAAIVGR